MLQSIPNAPSCSEDVHVSFSAKHSWEWEFQEGSKVVWIVQDCAFEKKQKYKEEVPGTIRSSAPVPSIMI